MYQKAIQLDPTNALGYVGWGNTLFAQGAYEEAIALYKKGAEIDPSNALPYYAWGVALQKEGKQKAAEDKFAISRLLPNSYNAFREAP